MVEQKFVLLLFFETVFLDSRVCVCVCVCPLPQLPEYGDYRARITFLAWSRNLFQGFRTQWWDSDDKVVVSSEQAQLL